MSSISGIQIPEHRTGLTGTPGQVSSAEESEAPVKRSDSHPTIHFGRPGKTNTQATLKAALRRCEERGLRHVVVASTTGSTALKLAKMLPHSSRAVCVTHTAGFREPGKSELPKSVETILAKHDIPVLRTTHLFSGVDRAVRLEFGGLGTPEIVANTLRILGEGMKVAVEIAVMALDAGLIPYGKDVCAVAGTGRGADTAVIVRPAHSRHFFKTRVKEIICKPGSGLD